jgi:hypothetical protein
LVDGTGRELLIELLTVANLRIWAASCRGAGTIHPGFKGFGGLGGDQDPVDPAPWVGDGRETGMNTVNPRWTTWVSLVFSRFTTILRAVGPT